MTSMSLSYNVMIVTMVTIMRLMMTALMRMRLDVCSFSYLHRIPVVLHLQVFAHFRELHRIQHETQDNEEDQFRMTMNTSSDRDEQFLFLMSTFMTFSREIPKLGLKNGTHH